MNKERIIKEQVKEFLVDKIEMIKDGRMDIFNSEFDEGVWYACDMILSFLEFLPEQNLEEPYKIKIAKDDENYRN